jgi:ADP-heptose:LPS heptosyltransferase
MSRREPQAVLVIQRGPLRDFVTSTAAMRQIRAAHPQARITLLTTRLFQPLARAAPYFDAIEADGDARGAGEWMTMIGRLRAARFERVYDLTAGGAGAIRIGLGPLTPAWIVASPKTGAGRRGLHPLDGQAEALRAAGVPAEGGEQGYAAPPDLSWVLKAGPNERSALDAGARRPHVLFIPAPSETPAEARWPAERYGELGRLLRQRGYDLVIVGTPQDGEQARRIQHQAPGARDLTGAPDYVRIAQLAARATVAVGSDSSFLHLAVAAGAPGVVLCPCALDPALGAPRGHVTALQADALADLPPDSVVRAIESLSPQGVQSA